MIETLNCAYGHTFTRERKRGVKPTICDEHKAQELSGETTRPENTGEVAPVKVFCERAWEILTGDRELDPEYVRKLEYTVKHLESGRRETGDSQLLQETQDRLIAEYERVYA